MSDWSGDASRRARARVSAQGWPQPCTKCGRLIDGAVEAWHADHFEIDRVTARDHGIPLDQLPVGPAHARCNTAAGGKVAAARRQARRFESIEPSMRRRNLRGV